MRAKVVYLPESVFVWLCKCLSTGAYLLESERERERESGKVSFPVFILRSPFNTNLLFAEKTKVLTRTNHKQTSKSKKRLGSVFNSCCS